MPADLHPALHATAISIVHEVRAAPLGNTKMPKPFSSLHQMVNYFSRGTAASTTDFVSLGIRRAFRKLTTRSNAAGDGVVCYRSFVAVFC